MILFTQNSVQNCLQLLYFSLILVNIIQDKSWHRTSKSNSFNETSRSCLWVFSSIDWESSVCSFSMDPHLLHELCVLPNELFPGLQLSNDVASEILSHPKIIQWLVNGAEAFTMYLRYIISIYTTVPQTVGLWKYIIVHVCLLLQRLTRLEMQTQIKTSSLNYTVRPEWKC